MVKNTVRPFMTGRFPKLLFYLLLVLLWEGVCRAGIWARVLLPAPSDVLLTLVQGLKEGTLLLAFFSSLRRILVSFTLALTLGITGGLMLGRIFWLDRLLGSLIIALQSIPSVVWLPLALLWFGMGEGAIIFITSLGATWTMIINTGAGVKRIPPLIIKAAQTMGVSRLQLFTRVIVPASVPAILTGMRLAWAFAWRALMAGELLSSGTGLGQVLMMGRNLADMSQILAVMVIIGATGVAVDGFIFRRLEERVHRRWGLTG